MENPEQLKDALLADVAAASDLDSLEQLRVSALGRKGRITDLMKGLGGLDPDERKATGQALNQVKEAVQSAIDARKTDLQDAELDARLVDEAVDVTLPVEFGGDGRLHPISQTLDEVIAIFGEMGFSVAEGPDIEDDFHNFEALNIPPEHPARQMHDTFYLPEKDDSSRMVLRTHTSPVQIRTMETEEPPIRIIAPGRTYRCDSDLTHTPMFHQVEGLVVDKTSHMGHLKGCLIEFCRAYFEVDDVPVRFRPSYFPFTEPSAEFDIQRPDGSWIELGGSGMVHPNVLRAGGLDPEEWSGFAFGFGIDRMAIMRHGVADIREMFADDIRFLEQF